MPLLTYIRNTPLFSWVNNRQVGVMRKPYVFVHFFFLLSLLSSIVSVDAKGMLIGSLNLT